MAKEDKEQKMEKTQKEEVEASSTGRKKIKPKLDKETKNSLEKRRERYEKQPDFKRGEWFRYKRLGTNWRRPRAVTNKMRKKLKYRPPKVRIGFGKPSSVRDFHPSGFVEVLVHNVNELEGMDPKVQAARIGSTVGTRKRRIIIEAADAKGIRVLNRGVL
jgi:large subunit ribosomal protein L32e